MSTLQFDATFMAAGEQAYVNPTVTYKWPDMIAGVLVRTSSGAMRKSWPVEQNTWRGFHKQNKQCPGAGDVFKAFFLERQTDLVAGLLAACSTDDVDKLSDQVCQQLAVRLGNIRHDQLRSYNKIRKPIDLYFVALVAMATELDAVRARLAALLFLPLDSWILGEPAIFAESELRQFGLTRQSTYQSVKSKETYQALQDVLQRKASALSHPSRPYHRIYFDLVWNGRFKRTGRNLYESNF